MKKWMMYVVVTAAAVSGYGDDWAAWRGPARDGISKETGWNAEGAKKLWTKELGVGYSSVSVKDGKLYTPHVLNSKSKTYRGDQWVTVEIEARGGSAAKAPWVRPGRGVPKTSGH